MVKRARPKRISDQQRKRDLERRAVLFLPNGEWKDKLLNAAKRKGFEHRLPGADELTPNLTAYVMYLHRQDEIREEKANAA